MGRSGWQFLSIWSVGLVLALAGGVTIAQAGVHNGGVGSCSVCHSMHNAASGQNTYEYNPGDLLIEGTSSDICLSCHADNYGAVLGTNPLMPPPERGPGNFVFLLADNLNDGIDGVSNPIPGDAAGHNIKAPHHGLANDGTHMTSPGGNFPTNRLRCTSCHDPHGNSNYRFLRSPGNVQVGTIRFYYDAPIATGLDVEFGGTESNGNHVAHISGMSLWCANCHYGYLSDHNDVTSGFEHPTDDTFDSDQIQQYNLYNGTANPTGGQIGTAYLAAVPFEDAGNTISSTAGPSATSRLMCLTCHRAHATSAPSAGRWDFNITKLGDDGVVSGSYPIANPYLEPDQDPLCWKCHEDGED